MKIQIDKFLVFAAEILVTLACTILLPIIVLQIHVITLQQFTTYNV